MATRIIVDLEIMQEMLHDMRGHVPPRDLETYEMLINRIDNMLRYVQQSPEDKKGTTFPRISAGHG